jgi:hypothetical protein
MQFKIGEADECWPWEGPVSPAGYGRAGKLGFAYRALYEAMYGAVSPGWCVDHLCCNKVCVNPHHLQAVPHSVNVRRARKLPDNPSLAEIVRRHGR